MDIWIVDTKGGPNQPSFEISVLRGRYTHGRESYGWFGSEKLLISSSGGPCNDQVTQLIWDKLVKVAEEVADELNAKEVTPNVVVQN